MNPTHCPRCDAPLSGTEKSCPACHRPLSAPGALASVAAKTVTCPICKLPMYPATIDTLGLQHCAECQGTAASRETLMKLSPHGAKKMELSAEESQYKRPPYFEPRKKPPFLICPLCQKRMKEIKLGPMNVDLCEACNAMWLDGAKIEHLGEVIGPYKWRMTKR